MTILRIAMAFGTCPSQDELYDYLQFICSVFWFIIRQLNSHSHLGSPSLRNQHEGHLIQ